MHKLTNKCGNNIRKRKKSIDQKRLSLLISHNVQNLVNGHLPSEKRSSVFSEHQLHTTLRLGKFSMELSLTFPPRLIL
jgi:hypothetical protein